MQTVRLLGPAVAGRQALAARLVGAVRSNSTKKPEYIFKKKIDICAKKYLRK